MDFFVVFPFSLLFAAQVNILQRSQAVSGLDFTFVASGSLTISAGQRVSMVNITILPDVTPELNQVFAVDLLSVVLTTGQASQTSNNPKLGQNRTGTVTILRNDKAHGEFIVYVSSTRQQSVRVNEQRSFAVQLTVERLFSAIGTVTVTLSTVPLTAVAGDFDALRSTLSFADGASSNTIPVVINQDTIPETDESFNVSMAERIAHRQLLVLKKSGLCQHH